MYPKIYFWHQILTSWWRLMTTFHKMRGGKRVCFLVKQSSKSSYFDKCVKWLQGDTCSYRSRQVAAFVTADPTQAADNVKHLELELHKGIKGTTWRGVTNPFHDRMYIIGKDCHPFKLTLFGSWSCLIAHVHTGEFTVGTLSDALPSLCQLSLHSL